LQPFGKSISIVYKLELGYETTPCHSDLIRYWGQTAGRNEAMKTNCIVSQYHDSRGRRHAFTLLELLVVIGTLAVLAVLLIPALARTDDNGARMVCMNNLRQMGMASGMYVGDNQDHLPHSNWDGGNNSAAPRGWLYSMNAADLPVGFAAGTVPDPYSSISPYNLLTNPAGTNAWQSGLWFQYVKNFKAYLCPVDIENKDYLLPSGAGGRNNKLSTYVMNGAVDGFTENGVWPTPCKITDVWSPACYLLWEPDENASGPGNPGAFEYNDGANFPNTSEGIGRLHTANSGAMLCVGGNVQFVTAQTFHQQSVVGSGPGPSGKTLAWWYPGSPGGD
jgi:type II secretory pathway pseudopilin PulG